MRRGGHTGSGHEVSFLDGGFLTDDQIVKELRRSGPEMVGVYLTTYLWKAMVPRPAASSRRCRGAGGVGGPLASGWKQRCLAECADADIVAIGEGEVTGPELATALEKKGDLSQVLGIAYREGDEIRANAPRPPIPDLNVLPLPARDLIDIPEYIPPLGTYQRLPAIYLYTSRGLQRGVYFLLAAQRRGRLSRPERRQVPGGN